MVVCVYTVTVTYITSVLQSLCGTVETLPFHRSRVGQAVISGYAMVSCRDATGDAARTAHQLRAHPEKQDFRASNHRHCRFILMVLKVVFFFFLINE